MNVSKLLKIEMWRSLKTRRFIFLYIAELIAIILSNLDSLDETYFSITDIFLTQYLGISLTFRYVYSGIIISSHFSKDIEIGIVDTYIAVGAKKILILIGKWLCAWLEILIVVVMASITYVGFSFAFNGVSMIPLSFVQTICLSLIPLLANSLLLTVVDLIFLNSIITVFCAVFLIVISGLLPYDVLKWLYLGYNNPITVFLYGSYNDIFRMLVVVITSLIIFASTSVFAIYRRN